jgi:hypothetical protein
VDHSERLWLARLRWRMRGAWLWPAFFVLTAVDGALIALLPPYEDTPPGLVGGILLAGFANLVVVAVLAPAAGLLLRKRRRDLPRVVAQDYAGAALLLALSAGLLAAGLAHRPAVAAEQGDEAALIDAVQGYVGVHAADWRGGLDRLDAVQLGPEVYRACVPGADPRRALCLIVDTDRRPARVARDDSMEPNRR